MRTCGVEATIGTWHMPLTTFFSARYGYRMGDFPVADDVFRRAISLPLHHLLTDDDQATVVRSLVECAGGR